MQLLLVPPVLVPVEQLLLLLELEQPLLGDEGVAGELVAQGLDVPVEPEGAPVGLLVQVPVFAVAQTE